MGDFYYETEDRAFTVSQREALSHHMPISHFHSTFEIYYLISGEREFFIQDRTLTISAGDIVIIQPNILHRTTNTARPKHKRFIVNMHERYFSTDGSHREMMKPLFQQHYAVLQTGNRYRGQFDLLYEAMMKEMVERRSGFQLYTQSLTVQFLLSFCRLYEQEVAVPMPSPSPMHERVSQIVRHMNEHYMDDLSLNAVAERFYISPYYLSRSFKEATGFTFVEYLNSVRVKEAKKLLEASSLKANVIAKKVGFGSVTHFGRVFKQITGHAPLYYRKG